MGEEQVPLIYGTDFQARALAAELAENEVSRFMVGTQNLYDLTKNQIHIIDLNDETGVLNSQVYSHPVGEVWDLSWSAHDPALFSSTYNCLDEDSNVLSKCSIWEILPGEKELKGRVHFNSTDVKMSMFHPFEKEKFATVSENEFTIWDLGTGDAKELYTKTMDKKGHSKLSSGKWNPTESGAPFCSLQESSLRGWDLRVPPGPPAWAIDHAHSYHVRDVDYNRNRTQSLASCGDDCLINVWDLRSVGGSGGSQTPALRLSGHSHWVWAVRFNHLHDELILSSSSDARIILWWGGSVGSEEGSSRYPDGKLVEFPDLEDSVYRLEWSTADPWLFAGLSYDGRLLLDRVPREHKYRILDI